MFKKLFPLIALFLSSCISISVETPAPVTPEFVTPTLMPTRPSFYTPAAIVTNTPFTLTVAVTAPPNCKDQAVLLKDVTYPDGANLKAGEHFTKTWQFQNMGDCPWVDYSLAFVTGDRMSAPDTAPVQQTLQGEKVNISVDLVAPSTNGTYSAYFVLNNKAGKPLSIGTEKTFWVKVTVGAGIPPQSTPTP